MQFQTPSIVGRHVCTCFRYLVGKENGRLDFSFAATRGAHFRHVHFYRRTNALASDLHQTELAERQHVMLRPVAFHQFAHILIQLLLVSLVIHIDEIDDDDTSDVSQAKLVHQLIRRQHIELERILLLVLE